MDTSYLTEQVAKIIADLHGLFDDIGVDAHERNQRESDVFAALSDTLHNQVKVVESERQSLADEAEHLSSSVRQIMIALGEESLLAGENQGQLQLTRPLRTCVQNLKERYLSAQKLHKERFEQVQKLVIALHSYASHMESSFVKVKLPHNLADPRKAPDAVSNDCPPTFSISAGYIADLDSEFTRVYEEYNRRMSSVRSIARQIIDLWAELGTPDAQIDNRIVEHANNSPEQLGLRSEDVKKLKNLRERLVAERTTRQSRLDGYLNSIEQLWNMLDVDQSERRAFVHANKGISLTAIKNAENELERLNELKRHNMGLFVEGARVRLQSLWDELFFSEEDMYAFRPAWSDNYSDELLALHETEIGRLQALARDRKPILGLIARHQSLLSDRSELEASSQDASRLMLRGQKGERRDPGKLLREEKMRKRIGKELPRVEADLRALLDGWENQYGRDFMVRGEAYISQLDRPSSAEPDPRRVGGASTSMGLSRPKSVIGGGNTTMLGPSGGLGASMTAGTLRGAKSSNFGATVRQPGPLIAARPNVAPMRSKTPTSFSTSVRPAQTPSSTVRTASTVRGHSRTQTAFEIGNRTATVSPTRLPSRMPLSAMRDGGNGQNQPIRPMSASPSRLMKPGSMLGSGRSPPKMKDLFLPPPSSPSRTGGVTPTSMVGRDQAGSIIRQTAPEDAFEDRAPSRLRLQHYPIFSKPGSGSTTITTGLVNQSFGSHSTSSQCPPSLSAGGSTVGDSSVVGSVMSAPSAAAATAVIAATSGARQTSASSTGTTTSECSSSFGASALVGSENWESYGPTAEEEDGGPNKPDDEVTMYRRQQERYYAKVQQVQKPTGQASTPSSTTTTPRRLPPPGHVLSRLPAAVRDH